MWWDGRSIACTANPMGATTEATTPQLPTLNTYPVNAFLDGGRDLLLLGFPAKDESPVSGSSLRRVGRLCAGLGEEKIVTPEAHVQAHTHVRILIVNVLSGGSRASGAQGRAGKRERKGRKGGMCVYWARYRSFVGAAWTNSNARCTCIIMSSRLVYTMHARTRARPVFFSSLCSSLT